MSSSLRQENRSGSGRVIRINRQYFRGGGEGVILTSKNSPPAGSLRLRERAFLLFLRRKLFLYRFGIDFARITCFQLRTKG